MNPSSDGRAAKRRPGSFGTRDLENSYALVSKIAGNQRLSPVHTTSSVLKEPTDAQIAVLVAFWVLCKGLFASFQILPAVFVAHCRLAPKVLGAQISTLVTSL